MIVLTINMPRRFIYQYGRDWSRPTINGRKDGRLGDWDIRLLGEYDIGELGYWGISNSKLNTQYPNPPSFLPFIVDLYQSLPYC